MANENKNKDAASAQQSGSNQQKASFDEKHYNDDPNNMANYSGNFGAGTYDTDYGKGEYPHTNAKEQGDNWVDCVGSTKQNSSKQQK